MSGQLKGNYVNDGDKTYLNLNVQIQNLWQKYALFFKTSLVLVAIIKTSLFFRLRLMSFFIRRKMLSKKKYQVQMPVITNYQKIFKKSLSRFQMPNIAYIGGPSGIGKTQSIKRMISNQGMSYNYNISYWGFKSKSLNKQSLDFFISNGIPKLLYSVLNIKNNSIKNFEEALNYFYVIIGELTQPLWKRNQYLFFYSAPFLSFLFGALGLFNHGFIYTGITSLFLSGTFAWICYPFIKYTYINEAHVLVLDDVDHFVQLQNGAYLLQQLFVLHDLRKISLSVISSDNKGLQKINKLKGLQNRIQETQILPLYQKNELSYIHLLRTSPKIRKQYLNNKNFKINQKMLLYILNDPIFSNFYPRKFHNLIVFFSLNIINLPTNISQQDKFDNFVQLFQEEKKLTILRIKKLIKTTIKQMENEIRLIKDKQKNKQIQQFIKNPKSTVIRLLQEILSNKVQYSFSEDNQCRRIQNFILDKLNQKNIIRYSITSELNQIQIEQPYIKQCLQMIIRKYRENNKTSEFI